MKTYLRLLEHAKSLKKYVFPYFICSLLASVFGVLNFTLLIPLLDVLFNQVQVSALPSSPPAWAFSTDAILQWFQYHFQAQWQAHGKLGALRFACMAILGSVFISNAFKYFSQRILVSVGADTIASLRQAVFEKALRLDLAYFSEQKKGHLMARLTTDVQEVENSILRAFTAIFKELFSLLAFFFFLAAMSWKLTLFSLLILPLSGGFIALITRQLRRASQDVQGHLSHLISRLDEVFGAMRVIKAFRAEPNMAQVFAQENEAYRRSFLGMRFRQELTAPVSESLGVLVVTGILLYGGSLVLDPDGGLKASTFIAFIATFSQVMRPAKSIADAFSGVQRGLVSADRMLEILDTPIQIQAQEPKLSLPEFKESIRFENVSFAFSSGKKVLDGLSFELKKGQTLALVGPSGGGKSTIADLLPRFYDPSEGSIFIDGKDIRQLELTDLRRLMGIVTQESVLFNDSIFNNITFGTQASMEAVEAAARIAHAHEFIMQSPQGYQTRIGDRGSKLSGGQRQRLAIARAVLLNPPILILDEATSALDNTSERLVQEALNELMQHRTVLVIAHRLSTIQHADEILLLQKGKIMERGQHDALMQNPKGLYRKLAALKEGQ